MYFCSVFPYEKTHWGCEQPWGKAGQTGRKCFFSASLHFSRLLGICTLLCCLFFFNYSHCHFLLLCRTCGHPQPTLFFSCSLFKELKNLQERKCICEKKLTVFSAYKSFNLPFSLEVCCFVLCFRYLLFCLGLVYIAAVWWDVLGVSFQHHSDLQHS